MAELGKHFGDLESAKNDFTTVIKLCERYPLRNEQTLTSAMFALGKIYLDQQQVKDAKVWFIHAIDILTQRLKQEFADAGKPIQDEQPISELFKDSIFDTEQTKLTKEFIGEIQQYCDEVQFLEANKQELAKAMEKKQEHVEVTEAFSKAPVNAADFKVVALKKRTIQEITPGGEVELKTEKRLKE